MRTGFQVTVGVGVTGIDFASTVTLNRGKCRALGQGGTFEECIKRKKGDGYGEIALCAGIIHATCYQTDARGGNVPCPAIEIQHELTVNADGKLEI